MKIIKCLKVLLEVSYYHTILGPLVKSHWYSVVCFAVVDKNHVGPHPCLLQPTQGHVNLLYPHAHFAKNQYKKEWVIVYGLLMVSIAVVIISSKLLVCLHIGFVVLKWAQWIKKYYQINKPRSKIIVNGDFKRDAKEATQENTVWWYPNWEKCFLLLNYRGRNV